MSGLPSKLRIHGSRIAVSLVVLAVAGVTCAAAFALGPSASRDGTQQLLSSAGQALAGGSLSLKAGALAPGDDVRGSAVVRNDGAAPGRFFLNADTAADRPGAGGASLAEALVVTVTDVTTPGRAVRVYAGPPAGLTGVELGTFAQGESRSYRVVVSFPSSETDSAAFAGSSLELGLQWTAVTED